MTDARKVLITGAGTGLGAAVASHLGAAGWHVGLLGRRVQKLQSVAGALPAARCFAADVQDADAIERSVAEFQPDALVNAAAVLGQGDVWGELTPTRFAEVMAINVNGSFNCCAAVMRHWRQQGEGGDIVNISSLAGIRGLQVFPGFAAYAASKHAVVGLTEALALDGRAHGIRVNAIAPGAMRTPMVEPLGLEPATQPAELVETVAFLLDRKRSGIVNGSTLEVYCND